MLLNEVIAIGLDVILRQQRRRTEMPLISGARRACVNEMTCVSTIAQMRFCSMTGLDGC
jgi:hypothetical protein